MTIVLSKIVLSSSSLRYRIVKSMDKLSSKKRVFKLEEIINILIILMEAIQTIEDFRIAVLKAILANFSMDLVDVL
jgi:uncharacterized membrane protein YjdF